MVVRQDLNIVVVIQARMSSQRLPGKSLKKINGKPLLYYVLERAACIKHKNTIVLATSNSKSDDAIADYCTENGYNVFRGEENNCLSRYYHCAKMYKADIIVRLTGDDPFLEPEIIDLVIEKHLQKYPCIDFTSNDLVSSYPFGINVQVMSFDALEKAYAEAVTEYEKEHVVPYITEHKDLFRLQNVVADEKYNFPDMRLTVDTIYDFDRCEKILNRLGYKIEYKLQDVIKIVNMEEL